MRSGLGAFGHQAIRSNGSTGSTKGTSPPRYISFLTSANLNAKAPMVATEIRLEQAMQQAAASQLAA